MHVMRRTLPAMLRAREPRQALPLCAPPLVALHARTGKLQMHLQLRNLQPVGSFQVRPVGRTVLSLDESELARGLFTAAPALAAAR